MESIVWLVVGLIAGWLGGLVMKGSGYGLVGDIVVGILGAVAGALLFQMELVHWFRGGKIHRARESFYLAGLMDQLGVGRARH